MKRVKNTEFEELTQLNIFSTCQIANMSRALFLRMDGFRVQAINAYQIVRAMQSWLPINTHT
jgi:hypothetical protein